MVDVGTLVFLQNKEWYTKNKKGEIILTDKAPKDAVDSYKKAQNEYLKKMNNKVDFDIVEDSEWLVFPDKTFSTFKKQ